MSSYRVACAVGFVVAMAGVLPASAAEKSASTGTAAASTEATPELHDVASAWRVDAAVYLWAISMDGDAAVMGNGFSVDAPFSDTIDNADSLIGLMGYVEVGRDKWSLFFNPAYSKVGYDNVPTDAGSADIDVTTAWYEFGGTWRLCDGDVSGDADRRWSVDALGGGRVTDLGIDVDFSGGGSGDDSQTWIEPFIGARGMLDVTKHLKLSLRGDIGGFGLGSDFAWQAIGLLGWEFDLFGADATVFGGYRALSQDYDDGGFEWDVIAHGPVLGLMLSF